MVLVRGPDGLIVAIHWKGLMPKIVSVAVKLAALLILLAPSLRADTTLIPANAEWRYGTPEEAAVNADWRHAFNDSNWRVGPAQLGYGDGDEATVIPDHPPVVYFRKTFNVDAP